MSPKKIFAIISEMRRIPRVTLRVHGDDQSRALYQFFTRRHPRFWFIQNKRWGVALMPLPGTFEDYMRGRPRQVPRTNRRRAQNSGFTFGTCDPRERFEEIMDI